MLKNEELFVLIKSLSKSEKRHFTLYCKAQGGESSYLEVFNSISAQDEYDEQAIKRRFAGEKFISQFHVMKNYLRGMILKSLRNFHGATSKDAELKDSLRNVEILFFKELFTHASVELKRAEKIAREYEIHTGLFEVQNWQRRIAQHRTPQAFEQFDNILSDQKETLANLENQHDYVKLIVDISQALINSQMDQVDNEQLLEDPANAKSLEAKVMHYNAAYFRDIQRSDTKQSEHRFYELLEYLEGHPIRLKEDPGLYASSMNNFVSYLAYQKRYEEAIKLVNRAKVVYDRVKLKTEKRTLLKQILRTYNIELEIYRDSDLLQKHQEFIADVEAFVVTNKRKMPEEYLESFTFQLANIHFSLGDLKAALKWVNEMLNTKWEHPRTDIAVHSRFLNLMIHFEMQNIFVLRYYVDSTRRWLKKRGLLNDFEKTMLRLFSQLGKAHDYEQEGVFASHFEGIRELEARLPEQEQGFVKYAIWVEHKAGKEILK